MKAIKIFAQLLFIMAFFAGCEKNDMSLDNPEVNINEENALVSKTDSPDQLFKCVKPVKAVYTLSNSASGNSVIMFERSGKGTLGSPQYFPTGGLGTGMGLGSQGAVEIYKKFLFAVNAGSNEISVFEVSKGGLTLVDKKPSGGLMPISLTAYGNLLYVLNAGGAGNIFGFTFDRSGMLTPIEGSSRPLSSGASGPAQISFSPYGRFLVVTEKATNIISTYSVDSGGLASGPNSQPSVGQTPFGFAFDKRGHIIVSEAFGGAPMAGATSSYRVGAGGTSVITGPVYNSQAAPCWVAITKNSKFAYVTNTGSGNISGYKIGHDGSIRLLAGNLASTGEGSAPIDMALNVSSQYLYALSGGTNTISVFRVNNGSGSLASIQTVSGLPMGSVGLTAN